MPALYAHDRFGKKTAALLSPELQKIISDHEPQFRIGLQGPDIFFFYHPWGQNRVRRYGSHLHHVSALPFFRHAARVVRGQGRDTAEYAYLLGFICHFTLDSECHPYVTERIEESGVAHLEIEEEFEKKLLRLDDRDPLAFPLATLVPEDEETVRAIAPFYPSMNEAIVQESLHDLRLVKKLFCAPQPCRQWLLNSIMKLTGHYAEMKGLMHQRHDNPKCIVSNRELLRRFDDAVPLAVSLITQYDAYVRSEEKLGTRFDRTFE